jgi:TonB-dependent starch-binding outer membrane protein SusC
MKKNEGGVPKSTARLFIKYLLMVKVVIILFCAFALHGYSRGFAQDKISLNLEKVHIKKAFKAIEKSSDFRFVYNDETLPENWLVSLNVHNATLEEVMGLVLQNTSLRFQKLNERLVVITKENPDGRLTAPQAAAVNVTGKVTNAEGEPLFNVSIVEKGTNNGTRTKQDGSFAIDVTNAEAVLVISYVGYITQEVSLGNNTTINIQLQLLNPDLQQIVVVGYATQKKVTVTGAVSAIKAEKLVKSPAVDMSNSLAGRLPGLVVIQQSGEPGYDGALIRIRGTNTIGRSDPLVVIDGVPDRDGGLGRLNPRDIDDISVLKDASAAIYGARAANGVILITTKKGKSGKPTVTYDFNQGISQPARIPKMSDAYQYANIMNELRVYSLPSDKWTEAWQSIKQTGSYSYNTGSGTTAINAQYSPAAVQAFKDGSDPWRYPNTDWFGDAFKKWSAQSRHNIQISGGTDNVKYLASLGYVYQDAYYKNSATYYKQYNFRTNLTAKISDYISTTLGIMARREERNFPTEGAGAIFRMLMRGRPTEPEVWPNGKPGPDIENGQNPYVITTNATGYVKHPRDYVQANGSVDITNPWVKGLKLNLSAAIDKTSEFIKSWQTPWMLYSWDGVSYEPGGVTPLLVGAIRSNFTDARLRESYGSILNTIFSAILSYEKVIANDHAINLLAGVSRERYTAEGFSAYRRNFLSTAIAQLSLGGITGQEITSNLPYKPYDRTRLGYFGRAQYNFREKYLAEFLWRIDGSSFFAPGKQFDFYPGIMAGWNISKEDFFNVPFINQLKLRASYGQLGNDQVYFNGALREYEFLQAYSFGDYAINNTLVQTLYEPVIANPNFTWEVANNYNVGVDAIFWKNRIDVTLEYFYSKRSKMLWNRQGQVPFTSGFSALPPENNASMKNSGFEFSINYNGKIANAIQIRAGVNGGYAKNKILEMAENKAAPSYQWQTGKPLGGYLVFKSAGVFKDLDDIAKNTIDYSGVTSNLRPGDMKFEDVNNDGKINGDDAVRIDKSITPTFNFGANLELRYKNFDLSMLFQGATGAAIRIQTESGDIGNYLEYFYNNRWSVDNPSSVHPRLVSRGATYYTGGNFGNNTYYLFDKNYIRLKNIELGYNLPAHLLSRFKITNLRIFVNGLNVFTIDKTKVFDPEATVQSGVYYPQPRVLNGGLTVTF